MQNTVRKFMGNGANVVIVFFSLVIILGGAYLLYPNLSVQEPVGEKKNLEEYAVIVIENCKNESYKPACFDKEIPKLMDEITMEEAFDVTRIVQENYPEYLYCHVLGHNLSRVETQKDPSKWKEVLTRCPTTMCNNGCLHGSMMYRFNSESLTDAEVEEVKPDIKDLCEPRGDWNPVPVEISMCYHSIGHLNMFLTGADIQKALELCEWVGVKDNGHSHVQTCTHGVFMSVFQPLEPEDFALVADLTPKKEDVIEFCEPYKDNFIYWEACRAESWPLFRVGLLESGAFMENFCAFSGEDNIIKTCQSNMMSFVTVDFFVNHAATKGMDTLDEYCSALSKPSYEANCFAHAAARLVQLDPIYTDLAMDVCEFADYKNNGDKCYETLSSSGSGTYHPDTKEIKDYCGKMPDKWKTYCLRLSDQ